MKSKLTTDFLSTNDIAQLLGVSYMTARRVMMAHMKCYKIGRCYRVHKDEFQRYLKAQERT